MPRRRRPIYHRVSLLVERRQFSSKVDISVHIDDHYRSKVYTTSSPVSGHAKVTTSQDISLSEIRILLLGISKTSSDIVNIPQTTSHVFLKLAMPIPDQSYPESSLFKAGTTYSIPFNFIIPQHLTLNACTHRTMNECLKEDHLRLPPSLGDWDKDDFAPHTTRIRYYVRASAYQDFDGRSRKVAEDSHDIKVMPSMPEAAPLNITEEDKLYLTTKSKRLRRCILSRKLGNVTASAHQPAPVMISSDGYTITPTTAQIDLAFEPTSSASPPPRITGVTSKVTAITCYSAGHILQYPNLKDWARTCGTEGRGAYHRAVPLRQTPVQSAAWTQHLRPQEKRNPRDGSDSDSDSDREATCFRLRRKEKSAPYYYTTTVRVPVQLPTTRHFVPTFHSCITSRVYVLWMAVTLSTPAGKSSTITLGVPLQIGLGPREEARFDSTGLPSFDAAMEEAGLEIDAYLRPRILSIPDVEFRSVLPGYPGRTNSAAPPA